MHSRSTSVGYILAKRSLDPFPCNMGSGWIPGWIFPVGSVEMTRSISELKSLVFSQHVLPRLTDTPRSFISDCIRVRPRSRNADDYSPYVVPDNPSYGTGYHCHYGFEDLIKFRIVRMAEDAGMCRRTGQVIYRQCLPLLSHEFHDAGLFKEVSLGHGVFCRFELGKIVHKTIHAVEDLIISGITFGPHGTSAGFERVRQTDTNLGPSLSTIP